MRSRNPPQSGKFADSATNPSVSTMCLILNHGEPIPMPSALASLLRATAQPSLLDKIAVQIPMSSEDWNFYAFFSVSAVNLVDCSPQPSPLGCFLGVTRATSRGPAKS